MDDAWQAELDDMEKNLKQSLISKAKPCIGACHPMGSCLSGSSIDVLQPNSFLL